jgi:hypothetical protein
MSVCNLCHAHVYLAIDPHSKQKLRVELARLEQYILNHPEIVEHIIHDCPEEKRIVEDKDTPLPDFGDIHADMMVKGFGKGRKNKYQEEKELF